MGGSGAGSGRGEIASGAGRLFLRSAAPVVCPATVHQEEGQARRDLDEESFRNKVSRDQSGDDTEDECWEQDDPESRAWLKGSVMGGEGSGRPRTGRRPVLDIWLARIG